MASLFLKAKVVVVTALATVIICVTDHLPQSIRRRVLSSEYSGKELEERLAVKIFAGWSTTKAVYRMLSINMNPLLKIGQHVGDLKVLRLSTQEVVTVVGLTTSPARPLVLNFGSCT